MKKLGILIFIAAGNVFAFQPRFEVEYTNYAWGYVNHGCMVDAEGNVYKYAYGQASDGKGIVPAGKLSDADLKAANDLAEKALLGKFTQKMVAADAGSTEWLAHTQWGQQVRLQTRGDVAGENSAPEAKELVELLNKACGTSSAQE